MCHLNLFSAEAVHDDVPMAETQWYTSYHSLSFLLNARIDRSCSLPLHHSVGNLGCGHHHWIALALSAFASHLGAADTTRSLLLQH